MWKHTANAVAYVARCFGSIIATSSMIFVIIRAGNLSMFFCWGKVFWVAAIIVTSGVHFGRFHSAFMLLINKDGLLKTISEPCHLVVTFSV